MSQMMIPAALAALILALTRPALGQAPAAGDSLRLKVDGMVCSLCAYGMERRLKKLHEVEQVKVELDSGLVVVVLEPGATLCDSTLSQEVGKAGFALRGVARFERARKEPARR
jgi:mercuric ion binding protein